MQRFRSKNTKFGYDSGVGMQFAFDVLQESLKSKLTSAHPRLNNGTLKCPIQKYGFFVLDKAAQGFAVRRTQCTSQPETRGERRTTQKRLFLNGH